MTFYKVSIAEFLLPNWFSIIAAVERFNILIEASWAQTQLVPLYGGYLRSNL